MADRREHGNGDKQRRGNLADAGVVDNPPQGQIEQRDAADDHRHPGRVHGQLYTQPGRRTKLAIKKNAAHQGHGPVRPENR